MGVNARTADNPTALVERITASREAADIATRARVRQGELSVEDYLVRYKGYSLAHAAELAPRFRRSIFEEEAYGSGQ